MDKTTLNAQLITTESVNAKDQICGKVLIWLPVKRMRGFIWLLVRLVFRHYE